MALTYEPIATTTLGSANSTINFSNIPATYTDLRVVLVGNVDATHQIQLRFNGDTTTNYSDTRLDADGATVSSSRRLNQTLILTGLFNVANTIGMVEIDIFSYTNSTFKTTLNKFSYDKNGSGLIYCVAGLWRSTSAITSVTLTGGSNFNTGTTATLYGIKAA